MPGPIASVAAAYGLAPSTLLSIFEIDGVKKSVIATSVESDDWLGGGLGGCADHSLRVALACFLELLLIAYLLWAASRVGR